MWFCLEYILVNDVRMCESCIGWYNLFWKYWFGCLGDESYGVELDGVGWFVVLGWCLSDCVSCRGKWNCI